MPMTWNPEADAKLMAAIMQVSDVRLSSDQMKQIASIMGPECTIKALYHRMSHFRKLSGTANLTTKAKTATEKPAKVTKPKPATKGKVKKTTVKPEPTPPPSDDDNQGPPTPPASARGKKRARINDDDDDDDGLSGDVKIEVGEDIGEGLRAGAPDEDEF